MRTWLISDYTLVFTCWYDENHHWCVLSSCVVVLLPGLAVCHCNSGCKSSNSKSRRFCPNHIIDLIIWSVLHCCIIIILVAYDIMLCYIALLPVYHHYYRMLAWQRCPAIHLLFRHNHIIFFCHHSLNYWSSLQYRWWMRSTWRSRSAGPKETRTLGQCHATISGMPHGPQRG